MEEQVKVSKVSWWHSACRDACGEVDWYKADFRLWWSAEGETEQVILLLWNKVQSYEVNVRAKGYTKQVVLLLWNI